MSNPFDFANQQQQAAQAPQVPQPGQAPPPGYAPPYGAVPPGAPGYPPQPPPYGQMPPAAPTGADPFGRPPMPGQAPYPPQQGYPAQPQQPYQPAPQQPQGYAPQAQEAQPDFVDTDEQTSGSSPVPDAIYTCRLATMGTDPSKQGKAMVTAVFEIVQGPESGREIRKWYVLAPTYYAAQRGKPARWNSRGIADLKGDMTKIGQGAVVPSKMSTTDAQAAAQVLHRGFTSVGTLQLQVKTERRNKREADGFGPDGRPKYRDVKGPDGKPVVDENQRVYVMAAGGSNVTPAGAANPFGL